MKINLDNWTHCQFTNSPLRAFVSLGAAPEGDEGVCLQYLVTLTDGDYQELFQSIHPSLDEALVVLNDKYGQWSFEDATKPASATGCSSCAAH
jgi:hypothetical protein